jgi:hypothetical protein
MDHRAALSYLLSILEKMLSKQDPEGMQKYQLLKEITLAKVDTPAPQDDQCSLFAWLYSSALQLVAALFKDFEERLEAGEITAFVKAVERGRLAALEQCEQGAALSDGHAMAQLADHREMVDSLLDKFGNLAKLIEIQHKLGSLVELWKSREQGLRIENEQLRGRGEDSLELKSQFFEARNSWQAEID